jgi:DNA-directed RNA polymerase specialized sigma24 family protein
METGDPGARAPSGRPGEAPARRRWALTPKAFDSLLAGLDSDRESAGKKYVEVRCNLVRFFEWRGCPFPDDHADETLDRVAKRALGGEDIRDPVRYILGTARMILLEVNKARAKERLALGELANTAAVADEPEPLQPRLECLERCLGGLAAGDREMILQYYRGDKRAKIENRKRLTERLQIPLSTLRMRALRVRERLQACVEECLRGDGSPIEATSG